MSQDGTPPHAGVANLTKAYASQGIRYMHHVELEAPTTLNKKENRAYYRIANHYKFIMQTFFDCFKYPRLIILEVGVATSAQALGLRLPRLSGCAVPGSSAFGSEQSFVQCLPLDCSSAVFLPTLCARRMTCSWRPTSSPSSMRLRRSWSRTLPCTASPPGTIMAWPSSCLILCSCIDQTSSLGWGGCSPTPSGRT